MRARRPHRSAFRPALEALPHRRAPSGGLSFASDRPGGVVDAADPGSTADVRPLEPSATLQQTDLTTLG